MNQSRTVLTPPFAGIFLSDDHNHGNLKTLADQFGLPIISQVPSCGEAHLIGSEKGLELVLGEASNRLTAQADLKRVRRQAGRVDPLIKAMGGPGQHVLDLTAGWGKDAFHLACNGYRVCAFEQHPALAMMLEHARSDIIDPEIAQQLRFVYQDSTADIGVLQGHVPASFAPIDVAYIDPMFPPKLKRSAAVKKEVALLQTLLEPSTSDNEQLLLANALQIATKRVVVKRPLRAPEIVGPKPSGAILGKLIRFDIYAPQLKH